MMVACILINRTHWRQVEPVLQRLRARCKDPKGVLRVNIDEITEIIKPLGLYNRRTSLLRRFALDWDDHPPTTGEDVLKMTGCGPYAAHSFMIFVEGRHPPLDDVSDHKLRWYLERNDVDTRQMYGSKLNPSRNHPAPRGSRVE